MCGLELTGCGCGLLHGPVQVTAEEDDADHGPEQGADGGDGADDLGDVLLLLVHAEGSP